ncbi:MAG TPA: GTPase-associated system all-helical protein GASH [Magnetospirillum sp.]|nr:GTPase-associated system all-helical protein GASH [Magnetospirillum sp.]
MSRLSVHMRISSLSPSNEDVDSRQKAVKQLAAAWGKINDIPQILAKAAGVSAALSGDGTPPATLSDEVEAAVQKHASAFLSSERPLEVGVCAGMAVLSVIEGKPGTSGWTIADLYSNALWLSLAFQPALPEEKREALRREVLERARERSLESANKARERETVPKVRDIDITVDSERKTTTDFQEIVAEVIDPLRRNAALDREELDFLWWAQLGRSRVLGRLLSDIPEVTRLVTMGIEGAGLLRRLPADVHREIILRTIDVDPELDLGELVERIGPDRTALAARIPETVTSAPTVYPLLNALLTGAFSGDGVTKKRKASTWGCRALVECTLARLACEGPGRL